VVWNDSLDMPFSTQVDKSSMKGQDDVVVRRPRLMGACTVRGRDGGRIGGQQDITVFLGIVLDRSWIISSEKLIAFDDLVG
jgi:hypothetical protein